MLKDIRYALRALRQSPGFALTAIVSIALAIGANSAIFSYADLLLFRPLSVPNPSQVVTLRSLAPSLNSITTGGTGFISYPDYVDYRDKTQSFSDLVAYQIVQTGFAPDPKTQTRLETGMAVSGNFFDVLDVRPQLGRGFLPEEDRVPGRDAVVVLAHDLWVREFGSDATVIGRRVLLNGNEFVVVGVAPQSFTGMDQWVFPAFYVPAMMAPKLIVLSFTIGAPSGGDVLTNRGRRLFEAKGRLKPGISIRAAATEASVLAKALEQSYPDTNRFYGATVLTELQVRMERETGASTMTGLLISVVAMILLIACANVANLVLARGTSRSREIAVRLALGASRARLIRQLMTESILIALAGGALALFIAGFAAERFSEFQVLSDAPVRLIYKVDARAVWFTMLVSVASAFIFGLAPALQSTKTDLLSAMKAGDAEQMRRRIFGRSALVVVQIAGSLVVLMGAAQAYFSAVSALTADYGFRRDHRLTMRLDPNLTGYSPEQTRQFYTTLIDRVGQVSGVKSAALSFSTPMTWDVRLQTVVPEGYEFPKGKESVDVMANVVDHHYFDTIAMPILQGRAFRETDGTDSPSVVVVNQAFAQEYLGESPIGKRLRLGRNGAWAEVIGIAPNSRYISPLEPALKYVYLPLRQNPSTRMTLIVETLGNPEDMAAPVQEVIRSMDQTLPVFRVQTMDFIFDNYFAKQVYGLRSMFTSAGLLALILALVGLYAVVAYEVSRRTREIGIRMAIGAAQQNVMKMILRQAMKVSLTGVIIGTLLTFILGQALKAALEVRFNPVLLAFVSFSLFLTTLLAASVPARRAARIDPMIALREE